MTTNHHTPIATGAAANASNINSPLSELDAAVPASGAAAIGVANTFTAAQKIDVSSALALLIEDDGVNDNVLVVDTVNARVGVGVVPLSPFHIGLTTEDLKFVDAGSASASEQNWIEVEVGGVVTGYIRVFASK